MTRITRRTIRVPEGKQWGHILSGSIAVFFVSEHVRLEKREEELIRENVKLAGITDNTPRGVRVDDYVFYTRKSAMRGPVIDAHPSLIDEFRHYYKLLNNSFLNQRTVGNLLSPVAVRCVTAQDFRDAFPDFLIEYAPPEYIKLPRTREEAFPVKDQPHLLRQYEEAMTILSYYQFNKMVF
jgi:hypothetical protein